MSKLVVDLDAITSNMDSLSSEVDSYDTSVNTFNAASINCSLEEVSAILDSYKESIADDLNTLENSSHQYLDLVSECCNEYQNNESETTSISISDIQNIVSSDTSITTEYDMKNAKLKLSSLPELILGAMIRHTGNERIDTIYNLLAKKGFNEAAICGILANMKQESGFNPEIKGDYGTSYGLCQWHNDRWTNLNNYCAAHGLSPNTVEGQVEYLCYELENSYTSVFNTLKNIPNTVEGAAKAAYDWTIHFEVPAYKEQRGSERANSARDDFWTIYGVDAPSRVTETALDKSDEKKET